MLLDVGSNEAATALLRSRAQSGERRFAALLQRSSDFIGFANLDGMVFYVNPAGRDLVGLEQAEDLSGLHVSISSRRKNALGFATKFGLWQFGMVDGSAK